MNEKIEVKIRVPNQTRYLSLIGKIGEDIARTLKLYHGDREELAFNINLVLTEAMANVIRHAQDEPPAEEVHIAISISNQELKIQVFDQGQGFDVCAVPAPNFKGLDEHGRGVFIIRSIMDRVSYRKLKSGNVLEMTKSLR
jgi:serine/threonine-protein kinase RsbW